MQDGVNRIMSELIKTILVATDGSDHAIRAAQYAAEIAEHLGARVVLLTVMQVSGVDQFVTYSIEGRGDAGDHWYQNAEEAISRSKIPFIEKNVPVRTKIIEGHAADVILHEAREGAYDMLVLGSHGSSAGLITRIVFGMGNVAERVSSNAPCPVLVVRVSE